jgi:NAD(P)-dependent dehydrogenase (short-subunit alcohol dehydrogenase family)
MKTVFISGANRGLGLEFARQYAAAGWQVLGGCRDPERADALRALPNTRAITLDVSNARSIENAAIQTGGQQIDLLINNAGIYGTALGDSGQTLAEQDIEIWMGVLRANVLGVFELTRALLPLIPSGGMVAIMSSRLGSIAENRDGGMYAYRSSKTAVNMVGRSLAQDLKPRGVTVVMLHPGWVATDMGGANAPVKPADSVAGLRKVLDGVTPDSTGRFLAWDGAELPW